MAMTAAMMAAVMTIMMAKAEAYPDGWWWVIVRREKHRRRHADGLHINNDRRRIRMRVVSSWTVRGHHDWCGRLNVNNRSWSDHMDRRVMNRMADGVDGGHSGENFADFGPFTITGACGLNTRRSEGGET